MFEVFKIGFIVPLYPYKENYSIRLTHKYANSFLFQNQRYRILENCKYGYKYNSKCYTVFLYSLKSMSLEAECDNFSIQF